MIFSALPKLNSLTVSKAHSLNKLPLVSKRSQLRKLSTSPDSQLFFLLKDTAESKAALLLLNELYEARSTPPLHSNSNLTSHCLLMGIGAERLFKRASFCKQIQTSTLKHSPGEASALELMVYPKQTLVFSGLACQTQLQLMRQAKSRGAYVIGYYDAFEAFQDKRLQALLKSASFCDAIWLPTEQVAHQLITSIKTLPGDKTSFVNKLSIVGHPESEMALKKCHRLIQSQSAKAEILHRLKVVPLTSRKLICYVCSYGGAQYEADLDLFIRLMTGEWSEYSAILCMHPSSDNSQIEQAILRRHNATNVRLLEADYLAQHNVSTAELCACSWRVAGCSLGSTVISQLCYSNLLQNRPWIVHATLHAKSTPYTHLVDLKLADLVQLKNGLLLIDEPGENTGGGAFQREILSGAAKHMAQKLLSLLHDHHL